MTDERKKEFALKISQANLTGLIVILYEIILVYIQEAEAAQGADNRTEFSNAIRKIRNCIGELMQSLNFKYEVASSIYSLYVFFLKELVRADMAYQKEPLVQMAPMIESLRKAYEKVSERNYLAPVMENTQTVYAGFTYGKTDVNVNLTDTGSRGFRV